MKIIYHKLIKQVRIKALSTGVVDGRPPGKSPLGATVFTRSLVVTGSVGGLGIDATPS